MFSLGTCPIRLFCDFESADLCGYTHDASGNFEWSRQRGSTSSLYTGPPYDHTTFTSEGIEIKLKKNKRSKHLFILGYYMYIETSAPRKQGEKARLISPTFPASKEYNCLQFFYHQYGADIGAFNVYKRDIGGSDEWHVMEVNIVPSRPYNIIFEGVVGKSFEGVSYSLTLLFKYMYIFFIGYRY
jgi:hypothetical protein